MPKLSERDCQPELMDDPALAPAKHRAALRALGRVNRWSRSAAIVWPTIRALGLEAAKDRPLRVLDIACGGGDVTREIARRARLENLPIQMEGCDINPVAVDYSRQSQSAAEENPVRFFRLDVLQEDLPRDYDVIMCSLFFHHLSREDAKQLLRRMAAASKRMVLVNDLRRTRLGYALAVIGCRLLTRSPIVHTDGPLSVRAAFSSEEIKKLALEAGLSGARIHHHWPQRFLLSWRKPV